MSSTFDENADGEHNGHAADDLGPPGIPIADDPKLASIGDLSEWAVGDIDLDFDEVRAGVIDILVQRWFERIRSPRDALDILVQEGIVAAEEVRADL
jgi:hypothetical protein